VTKVINFSPQTARNWNPRCPRKEDKSPAEGRQPRRGRKTNCPRMDVGESENGVRG